jgi:hypothetical protein
MPSSFRSTAVAIAGAVLCTAVWSQPAADAGRPAAVIPLESEPAAKLVLYPPLAGPLARGVVIIQYRTENMRIIPVFGMGAAEVSPRVGHLHVTVDDRPGTWAHTSGDPIIVVGLTPGAHKFLIEVADPNHKIITSETMTATVPELKTSALHEHKP